MSCCQNSVSIVLFPNGTRNDGTEEIIFDTKQAGKIYYFRDMTEITPTTNVLASVIVNNGSTISDLTNSTDKDLSTDATMIAGANDSFTLRWDFLSQSVRDPLVKWVLNISNGTAPAIFEWAGTDLIFNDPIDVSNFAVGVERIDSFWGDIDMRYVQMRVVVAGGSSFHRSDIFEVWDGKEGFGTSNANIQVKNNITGNFLTANTLSQIDSSTTEKLDSQTADQPNQNLTRIQLVNKGKWEGSVGAILVDPKFL